MTFLPRPFGARSRRATRIAFAVIVIFVLAQVVWWIVFQQRYIERVTQSRVAAWERDAAVATQQFGRLEASSEPADVAAAREAWLVAYPHLRFVPAGTDGSDASDGPAVVEAVAAGGVFEVDPAVRSAFVRDQRGYVRMFAFEGPFFVLVILGLLAFIARSLRAERELKRSQQNFLSAITHEFKTPISTLKLLVQTTRKRGVDRDEPRDYLQRMEAELDRLERTSDQILASARLDEAHAEGGRVPADELQPADLGALARDLVERARPGLEARGATLEFRPPAGPVPVDVDPEAFGVVLNNLLDNAVKYSFADRKRVVVAVETDATRAMIHVDDWGVGIPLADRDRIFERFFRSGDEMTRRAPGVGLGLHLAQRVASAMEAEVVLDDHPDGADAGSRFSILLPLASAPGRRAAGPRSPGATEGAS